MTGPIDTVVPDEAASGNGTTSAFVPVLILGLVMLAWFVFQAVEMRSERASMREVMLTQDKQMQEAKQVRDAFDSLVRGTAELAGNGNANAQLIVDDLKRHGVPIPGQHASTTAPGVDERAPK